MTTDSYVAKDFLNMPNAFIYHDIVGDTKVASPFSAPVPGTNRVAPTGHLPEGCFAWPCCYCGARAVSWLATEGGQPTQHELMWRYVESNHVQPTKFSKIDSNLL